MTESIQPAAGKSWPDYRAVWRWHFYASLFCIPFVIILAISGAIYLFKPQIEAWNDRPYDHLEIEGNTASAAEQIRAALAAVPGATLDAYELPTGPDAAARVIVRQNGEAIRVYLHPESLQVLAMIPENDRFTRLLFRLHGELLMGDRGSMVVELAASWTIIMILTGLYLWWPRQAKGLGGVVYPRLRAGSRIFWRDLHSVTGVWISALALFLLLSGLPWAKSWGNYLKAVRRLTGTAVAQQDWTTGSDRAAARASGGDSGEHGGHRRRLRRPSRRGDAGAQGSDGGRPDRRDRAAVGTGSSRADRSAPARIAPLDREVDDPQSAAAREPGRRWSDRRDRQPRRFSGSPSHRPDRGDRHRRPRRPTLRLAQPASRPGDRQRLDSALRERSDPVVASARAGRFGGPQSDAQSASFRRSHRARRRSWGSTCRCSAVRCSSCWRPRS